MIATIYTIDGVEHPHKEPIQLNNNFYRAVSEAEDIFGSKATNVSFERKSALLAAYVCNKEYRVLISEK